MRHRGCATRLLSSTVREFLACCCCRCCLQVSFRLLAMWHNEPGEGKDLVDALFNALDACAHAYQQLQRAPDRAYFAAPCLHRFAADASWHARPRLPHCAMPRCAVAAVCHHDGNRQLLPPRFEEPDHSGQPTADALIEANNNAVIVSSEQLAHLLSQVTIAQLRDLLAGNNK